MGANYAGFLEYLCYVSSR